MALRYQVKPPPPLFQARDVVRLLMLALVIGFMVFAIHKASDPRMWQWVRIFGKQPAAQEPEENVPVRPPGQLRIALQAGHWIPR